MREGERKRSWLLAFASRSIARFLVKRHAMLEARDKLITVDPQEINRLESRDNYCGMTRRSFTVGSAILSSDIDIVASMQSRDDLTNYPERGRVASRAIDQDIIVSLLRVRRSKRET